MTEARGANDQEGVQVTTVASTPSSLVVQPVFPLPNHPDRSAAAAVSPKEAPNSDLAQPADSTAASPASPETLDQLEFARALDLVAQRAVSELGAARVRRRLPRSDAAWVSEELAAVAELSLALEGDEAFRPEPIADLSASLAALATPGSVLEGPQLAELGAALAAMRAVARRLADLKDRAPRAAALWVEPPPVELERAIAKALDPDGQVRDEASSELARARSRVRQTRAQLVRLLEDILARWDPGSLAPGAAVTMREGRYVIPARRGARLAGIVHGASASGTTLFVEPEAAVPLGNALREHQADEARAALAVLRQLTEQARQALPSISAAWQMCLAADDLYARARYALDAGAQAPEVAPAPAPMAIRQGRHPLLLAGSGEVVPFDLTLEGSTIGLVISGPNTGGKTVLLKAVGLIAALAQAGVIPPVGRGTRLPVFRRLFADIGDHQSIAASLSTFSAHVSALREIVAQADAASLVLVDEIGDGTDPAEGAALAQAVLQALAGRGVRTIVTTHLAQLKEVASRTAGLENASLAFDQISLAPTYRFLQGVPGRSYGLAVARRLGLSEEVLAAAESALPEAARALEAVLADLEAKTQAAARREQELEAREAALRRREREIEARAAQLTGRERAWAEEERQRERQAREQARALLLDARRRVEEALGLARAAVSEATAKAARRLVEEGVRQEAQALKKLLADTHQKGWRVRLSGSQASAPAPPPLSPAPRRPPSPAAPAGSTEVDLRGLSVEEATAALTRALDAAVVEDLPFLRIIHGKGTGALREAVREVLARDRRVAAFRLAPPPQGGSGVTIADLVP